MRAFLDVLSFELQLQCRTRLFPGALLLYFVIHLLTMAEVGIHINDNTLVHVNSPATIFQTALVLSVFGLLPAMIFIVQAVVRDHERKTVELLYATPVGAVPWLLGRFSAGAACALSAGVAGLLGGMVGGVMPWLDPQRVAPFDVVPFVVSFAVVDLPNLLFFCAVCFSVAAIGRSQTWAFGFALALVVLDLILFNATSTGEPTWLALLDPVGGLPLRAASRYWTVAELNRQLPVTPLLVANRLLWLALGAVVLAVTVSRVRLDLQQASRRSRRSSSSTRPPTTAPATAAPRAVYQTVAGRFDRRHALAQFASQLRLDLQAVVWSPLFALIVAFTVVATISEFTANTDGILGLPLHPVTALMLGFFRYGLFQFVLMTLILYSATLVFREREHRLADIIGATPHGDWLMPVAKTLALMTAIAVLLLASMTTCIALQLLRGHRPIELAVYLQGLFVYNGAYFFMLCVLAVVVQSMSPGKWSGMLLLFAVFAALLSLEPLGFEHVLYGFRMPFVVYSDMNGFGHFRLPTLSLIAYWGLFCVLLLTLTHLIFPRGPAFGLPHRLRQAHARMTPRLACGAGCVAVLFAISGSWIYWNTNVLNAYETSESRQQARAAYERQYGAWKNRPTPAVSAVEMEVALYPEERRLTSRGLAQLTNRKSVAIEEFAVSSDPRLHLDGLTVEGATLTDDDAALGFRRYRLDRPLLPGDSRSMTWSATRDNRGFVNSGADNEIVANGTFVDLGAIMPRPAYDEERELTDPEERRRVGLPDAARLPRLDDPAWLHTLGFGIDGRMDFRVVFSTSADQTAVAAGVLQRQWDTNGRRYFEYVMDQPIWPNVAFASARYTVARTTWRDVNVEVYHDGNHAWNVGTMLDTASRALDYFSREYAPYPLRTFRIVEYPRYRTAAQASPGMVAYAEAAGFLTDLTQWAPLDYTTIHELAHQWWGGMVYGAKMQGRQMLNETMAQYSTLMLFAQLKDPQWLRRVLAATHRNYLSLRRNEGVAEQPLMLTEDQGNISYNKGALVMFALQDLIGRERMHQGLRNFLARFASQPPPYPTSRDLVNELRAVAGPEHQTLITNLFERIVLYDVAVTAVAVTPVDGAYDVTVDITAKQLEASGQGEEREVPLDGWFDLVLFPATPTELVARTPLYQRKERLQTGAHRRVIRVPSRPAAVGIDPFHLMIDRTPENNVYQLPSD